MVNPMSRLAGIGGLALVAVGLGAPVAAAQSKAPPAARGECADRPAQGQQYGGRSKRPRRARGAGHRDRPGGPQRAGTAHHHLFLDTDVTASDAAIPMETAGIVHLGKGQSEYSFEGVKPGTHRLIAVLADPNHVPLKPLVADTVRFTVK